MRISVVLLGVMLGAGIATAEERGFGPGARTLLCAHNAYPEDGAYHDRIDRALATGLPVSIEQDVAYRVDPETGAGVSIVSHGPPLTGDEPTLRDYFFERIRPIVEDALTTGDTTHWPLITVNIEFKDGTPAHRRAVWALLEEYADWLCSAERTADPATVQPLTVRPVLALTQGGEAIFHDAVPEGGRLLVFGSARTNRVDMPEGLSRREQAAFPTTIAPEALLTEPATNYRRWWNNGWRIIEQPSARSTLPLPAETEARIRAFAAHAHAMGYWIRFYSLNGYAENPAQGWNPFYNFGSLAAVQARWLAAKDAGVDFIASDQYEDLAATVRD